MEAFALQVVYNDVFIATAFSTLLAITTGAKQYLPTVKLSTIPEVASLHAIYSPTSLEYITVTVTDTVIDIETIETAPPDLPAITQPCTDTTIGSVTFDMSKSAMVWDSFRRRFRSQERCIRWFQDYLQKRVDVFAQELAMRE